ncbi:hypothetical protein BLOT_005927 [Blomia tropicalis]|nr:hypothetical protein BLOT_005927 [Blomia tropicalis]
MMQNTDYLNLRMSMTFQLGCIHIAVVNSTKTSNMVWYIRYYDIHNDQITVRPDHLVKNYYVYDGYIV